MIDKQKYDIVEQKISVNMVDVDNNVFEHIIVGDAFSNMSFTTDAKIDKIIYEKTDFSTNMPFEQTTYGYKLTFNSDDHVIHIQKHAKIIVHTSGQPKINYNRCVYLNTTLRRQCAQQQSNNLLLLRLE